MKSEFVNRLAMFRTVLALLDKTLYHPVWLNQPPLAFSNKAVLFRAGLADLVKLTERQEAEITGAAILKEREEGELEDKAHEIGQALSGYFEDAGREDGAEAVEFSLSDWQALRDERLLNRSNTVLSRLQAALAADAPGLVEYDLTPADATALQKEITDYTGAIAQPALAISGRKALTGVLRAAFAEVMKILTSMDKSILRLRKTVEGREFNNEWTTARAINDRGRGPGADEAVAQVTPNPKFSTRAAPAPVEIP